MKDFIEFESIYGSNYILPKDKLLSLYHSFTNRYYIAFLDGEQSEVSEDEYNKVKKALLGRELNE